MDHHPANWGRHRSDYDSDCSIAEFNPSKFQQRTPIQRTQQPVVTGTSVIAVKFKDGIMMAADTLASYGSLARFRDERRLHKINEYTVLGSSGDMSDYQYVQHELGKLMVDDYCTEDGHSLSPTNIYEYLCRLMYGRRNKMNPLWNTFLVGGFKDGESFLGCVDLHGTTWQASTIATGYGAYIALPLLRKAVEGKETVLGETEAAKIVDDAMRVLYYRDARSLNRFQRATVTAAGVKICEPYSVETQWNFAENIRGYGV